MPEPEDRYEQVLRKLNARHHRITPQRAALLRLIATSDEPPSASRLYDLAQSQLPTTSPAAFYKTLNLLNELGP